MCTAGIDTSSGLRDAAQLPDAAPLRPPTRAPFPPATRGDRLGGGSHGGPVRCPRPRPCSSVYGHLLPNSRPGPPAPSRLAVAGMPALCREVPRAQGGEPASALSLLCLSGPQGGLSLRGGRGKPASVPFGRAAVGGGPTPPGFRAGLWGHSGPCRAEGRMFPVAAGCHIFGSEITRGHIPGKRRGVGRVRRAGDPRVVRALKKAGQPAPRHTPLPSPPTSGPVAATFATFLCSGEHHLGPSR